jgi:hypothetical protein
MTRDNDLPLHDLLRAAVVARWAAERLSAQGDAPSSKNLEAVSDVLAGLSDKLAELGHAAPYNSAVRQRVINLRTDLDGHLRAAMAMGDLELPRHRSAVLLRIARSVAAELESTVGTVQSRRTA